MPRGRHERRAGIVVTGTEVLTGRVRDRNGPWLSDRLRELGVDLAHITICGDRPEDMEAQLRFLADQGVDLIVTSGGLGPTADDLTLEVVARFTGRPLKLDEALEQRIADILRPLMKRWRNLDFDAVRAANRKQALVPEGPRSSSPPARRRHGRAARRRVGTDGRRAARAPARAARDVGGGGRRRTPSAAAVEGATEYRQEMLRLFGIPESEIALALEEAGERDPGLDELEITTCLRRGEIEVVVRYEPDGREAWTRPARLHRRAPRGHALLHRRLERGPSGGGAAAREGLARGHRGVLHGRADGRAAHRGAGRLRLRGRRRRRVRRTTRRSPSWASLRS